MQDGRHAQGCGFALHMLMGGSPANIFSSSKNLLKTYSKVLESVQRGRCWALSRSSQPTQRDGGGSDGGASAWGDMRSGIAPAAWTGSSVLPRQLNEELQVSEI